MEEIKETFEDKLQEIRKAWNTKIKEIVQLSVNLQKISTAQLEILTNRQLLIEELYDMKALYLKLQRDLNTKTKSKMVDVMNPAVNKNHQVLIKTEKDKEIYLNGELGNEMYKIQLIDSQIAFLRDSIISLDKAGFSIKSLIDVKN